jgi:N6-L-threonylcarbamoyladenine synthase
MLILGIDTSCDDTSVAVYDSERRIILSEKVSTCVELHERFGGVVPEIAARQHLELLLPLIETVLEEAGIAPDPETIDLIPATKGPGLIGGLLVGLGCAKALSLGWNVPYVGVNHIEGHLISAELTNGPLPYPHVALIVSGGHSEIYHAISPTNYMLIGETRDDAAGELLDKVGRLLDLPFPSGKIIDQWTLNADPKAPHPKFPRPLLDRDTIEFSFSGLKTACLYFLRSEDAKNYSREIIGAEVFKACVDCLLGKAFLACSRLGLNNLIISGGVASSQFLRKEARLRGEKKCLNVTFPDPRHCTDNAAMIALQGFYRFRKDGADPYDLDCDASLAVG